MMSHRRRDATFPTQVHRWNVVSPLSPLPRKPRGSRESEPQGEPKGQWVKDEGASEGRSVTDRIGVELYSDITPSERTQTSLRSSVTRTRSKRISGSVADMTRAATPAGAAPGRKTDRLSCSSVKSPASVPTSGMHGVLLPECTSGRSASTTQLRATTMRTPTLLSRCRRRSTLLLRPKQHTDSRLARGVGEGLSCMHRKVPVQF